MSALKSTKIKGYVYLTKNGLKKVKFELSELINKKRIEVTQKIHEARNMGNIDENQVYESALEEQGFVEARIRELEGIISKAIVIKKTSRESNDLVVIGSKVTVCVGGREDTFTIVGAPEADPLKGKISNESPVGQALLGAKIGEEVEVTTPIIRAVYKVVKVF